MANSFILLPGLQVADGSADGEVVLELEELELVLILVGQEFDKHVPEALELRLALKFVLFIFFFEAFVAAFRFGLVLVGAHVSSELDVLLFVVALVVARGGHGDGINILDFGSFGFVRCY